MVTPWLCFEYYRIIWLVQGNGMSGKFIVIEGTDGSGKATQFKLLAERLKREGYRVAIFDFPRYGQPSAYFVEQYLHGHYGTADEVGPFRGAMFYAMDRYAASFEINKALASGSLVLSNRYVGSNMAHQGGKLSDSKKRKGYYEWARKMELEGFRIPEPDLNIVLHVSAETARTMINKRIQENETEKLKRDVVHETDFAHLKNAEQAYLELCAYYPDLFTKVECMDGTDLLSISAISELVWGVVKQALGK